MRSAVPWLEAASHKTWKAGITEGDHLDPGTGALLGTQLEPWYIQKLIYEAGWNDLFSALVSGMVCLAESQGFTRAIHVNLDGTEDRGIWQLNSIHKDITDDIAYDPVEATAWAFKLWTARNGWEDWAAYTTGVYLHDTYLGKAARGLGNYAARAMLEQPVPDWNGAPYTHRYSGSILNFDHRLAGAVHWIEQGKKDLGWQSAAKNRVDVVQADLAHGLTAAKQPLPN